LISIMMWRIASSAVSGGRGSSGETAMASGLKL
jgi:hypothetical protein